MKPSQRKRLDAIAQRAGDVAHKAGEAATDVAHTARGAAGDVAQRATATAGDVRDRAGDVRDRFSSKTHAAARYVAQRVVLKPTIWSLTDVTVIDRDRVKDVRGGFIVVANHSSHLDAPLILGALPRRLARYLATGAAADYFFEVRWRRRLTELFFNAFPVHRPPALAGGKNAGGAGQADADAAAPADGRAVARPDAPRTSAARKRARVRAGHPTVSARSLLQRGYPVLVFPEGTRSKDGRMGPFKPGAAALAASCEVPVIPLALIGANIAHPRGANWPRPGRLPVGVAFGDPMRPLDGETPIEFTARLRDEIIRLKETNTARILGPQNPSEGAHR
ncbi:lysophospholipid acyltransferase family protein [Frigoribacterium sp. 2-23]|uniref:lysophospholipid acyltransferase family protein n=1 Tax=Frigoribacterium sp. 2-23 TaxID=3415006 RepID=UPI003C6FF0F7